MKYLFLLGSAIAAVSPAAAWADEAHDAITVVARGSEIPLDQAGQSISIVGLEEIASVQGADLTRVLTRLPGVSFSRNGGLGAQTGLNVRGANADQLLVMVDGVRIADYSSPGGGYDLGNLLAGTVAGIELLRGSNSVVWGSQAIGGVLAVTTREVHGVEGMAEYGAYDTAYLTGTAGLSGERQAISLSAGYADSDGFSALAAGKERDSYRQWQLSGKGRLALGETITLRAVGRYADSRLGIDLTGPDSPDRQDTREVTARAGLDYAGERLTLATGFAWSDIHRDYETAWGPSSFKGRSLRAELRGQARIAPALSLDFGADTDWSRAQSSYDPQARARASSGHALLGYHAAGLSLAAGLRVDDHSRFGTHWTLGGNGSVALGGGWRLRASYGEGFKAPTLYQLFGSFVGNPALRPERSRSYDAGIELGDRNARLHAALTAFRRDSRNLIDLDSAFVYRNLARARAEGFEAELGARVSEHFRARAAYTWTRARDRALGRDLARRPRHMANVSVDWETPLAGLSLGGDIRLQGDSVEYDYLGNVVRLDGFATASLRASLPIGEHIELFGRVENISDERYQTAAGFASAGRSAYFGARARF